ncbi:hypothetical protein PanWU01x14_364270 [Parasponia andersonii]|uniref:Aspartic peptidase domain containing protein n=1 Tax=Parasponia andersonii TaxID=3476 RepID=A0A2P5A6G5_PARAD|nr:hypothetical protein PanWU01x14_364270 [Parasponia andersonii]
MVGRVLVDCGSNAEVLFLSTFENMGLDWNALRLTYQHMFTFNSSWVSLLGIIKLKVYTIERYLDVDFVIINYQSSFNVILGKRWIHTMHEVASTLHQVLRGQSKIEEESDMPDTTIEKLIMIPLEKSDLRK